MNGGISSPHAVLASLTRYADRDFIMLSLTGFLFPAYHPRRLIPDPSSGPFVYVQPYSRQLHPLAYRWTYVSDK